MNIKIKRQTITKSKGKLEQSTKLKKYQLSHQQTIQLTNALLDANHKNTEKSS